MTKSALFSQNGSIHTFRSSIEYESVLSRHDKFVDDWNDNNLPNTLEKGGIEIVRDQGKLHGHLCVAVTSNSDNGDTNSSNGNEIFNEGMSVAKYAVALSTGCSAVIPSQVQGLVEAHPWTSRNTTSAKKSLTFTWRSLRDGSCVVGSRHRRGHHYRQTQRNTQYFVDERLTEIFNQRGISIRNNANIKEVDFRNVDWMKELHIGSLPFIKVSAKKISEEKLVIVGSLILGTNFILFVSNNIVSVGGAVIPFVVGNGLMWPSFMSILSRRWIKASRSSTGRCG